MKSAFVVDSTHLERLLTVIPNGRKVECPAIADVEEAEKMHHGIDLVEEFRHRKRRDFVFEGLEPRGAGRQEGALAFDLRRLRECAFDRAETRLHGLHPGSRSLPFQ